MLQHLVDSLILAVDFSPFATDPGVKFVYTNVSLTSGYFTLTIDKSQINNPKKRLLLTSIRYGDNLKAVRAMVSLEVHLICLWEGGECVFGELR